MTFSKIAAIAGITHLPPGKLPGRMEFDAELDDAELGSMIGTLGANGYTVTNNRAHSNPSLMHFKCVRHRRSNHPVDVFDEADTVKKVRQDVEGKSHED
jgi:hypothetical protein